MLNYLWGGMILIAVVYGTLTGNIEAVGNAAVNSSKEAVELCITMLGVMALWTGIMKIAEVSGLTKKFLRLARPVLSFFVLLSFGLCFFVFLKFCDFCKVKFTFLLI